MNYSLDFTIPAGAQGQSAIEGIAYIEYVAKQSTKEVEIDSTSSFISNSTNFSIEGKQVLLKQDGIYEITFSGKIHNTTSALYKLKLIAENNGTTEELMNISINTKEAFFSNIKMANLTTNQNVIVIYDPNNNINASLENTILLIKKFR